jgi:LPXTG-motif cell wall-anchored protein
MVVAGNLLTPAVSKLNAGQSWKCHQRISLPSTCQSQGNLSLFLSSLLLISLLIILLLRRKKPVIKEPSSKRTKPSPAAIPQTPDAPIPSPARNDIDMEDVGG